MRERYDVVVVGSGAAGGTMAAHLARAGASVLVLEGGPKIETRTDFNTHALPFQFARRRIPTMKPGKPGFDSPHSAGVGGKTLLWNAVALRFSQRDFKGATQEGAGADWPIEYADLEPYYTKVEREVGLCGNRDGLPDLPDGEFLPAAPLKCSDEILKRGAARLGVPLIAVRKATLTRTTAGRPGCHFCGHCMAGCDVVAKYNSADVHLYPAQRDTGRLDILADSIVYELGVSDGNAAVDEVRFFDRNTGARKSVRGRMVVLGCACKESIALLLRSQSRQFPQGLANNNGQVGKHFIPHVTYTAEGFLKELIGAAVTNDEGFLDHSYIPSFMHERRRDYPRSFGIQVGYHNRRFVPWARQFTGIGRDFKATIKARYPAYMQLVGFMEVTPNANSYVDLHPQEKDQYGLSVTRARFDLADADWKRWRDMRKWCRAIMESSGAEMIEADHNRPVLNHALGGCRMGNDPATSVVDSNCRTHEVRNLYVVDGSVFPSASEKNPTLTIMAVSARAADKIIEALHRGEA